MDKKDNTHLQIVNFITTMMPRTTKEIHVSLDVFLKLKNYIQDMDRVGIAQADLYTINENTLMFYGKKVKIELDAPGTIKFIPDKKVIFG